MATQPKPYITEEQYLEMEACAEQKSEYFQGEIFPMEATIRHVTINDNLLIGLARELSGSVCRAYSSKLRVRIPATGLYTYPDITIVCGKPELSPEDQESITNPKVILEILSPSTEDYDRGGKFEQYRSMPSFCEYLVIAQNRIYAEHHVRQPDGGWLSHDITDGDTTILLESVGIRFRLSEAYTGVEF